MRRKSHITPGLLLARVTGCLALIGAFFILLKEDVVAGKWSDSFVLIPIMVLITIAAGHMARLAVRDRRVFSAAGFALAFVLGTALTVYMSVTKQQTAFEVVATQSHVQDDLKAKIDRAERRLQWYDQKIDSETSNGGCGPKCKGWKARANEVKLAIKSMQSTLDGNVPVKPVAAGAKQFATLANMLFGAPVERTKALILLIKPFAFSLLFELTVIVAFGYIPGQPKVKKASASSQPGPKPSASVTPDNVADFSVAFRAKNGRSPTVSEVQQKFNLSRGTAYRRMTA